MAKTRHISARMSQRGIKQSMVDLVLNYGVTDQDRVVLSRKGARTLLDHLDELRKIAVDVYEKGGHVVVVGEEGALITTYRLESYRMKARH